MDKWLKIRTHVFSVSNLPGFFFPMMCYFLQFLLLLQLAFQACPLFHPCWGGGEIMQTNLKKKWKTKNKKIVEKKSRKLHEIDAEHICDVILTVAFFASYQSVGVFAKVTCQWTNQTSEEKRVYMITSITCPKRIAQNCHQSSANGNPPPTNH